MRWTMTHWWVCVYEAWSTFCAGKYNEIVLFDNFIIIMCVCKCKVIGTVWRGLKEVVNSRKSNEKVKVNSTINY